MLLPDEIPLYLNGRFLPLAHNNWLLSLPSCLISLHLILYAPVTPAFQFLKGIKFILVLELFHKLRLECFKY